MKNNLKYLLLLTVMCVFTACEKDALDPLSGTYPAPVDYTLDAVIAQSAVKGATTRTFTLELGSSSQHLAVDFVGSRTSYFLTPGNYTIAAEAVAKSGNYVAGQTRWVTSGTSLALTDGTISVKLEGEVYTITGTVMLEDRSIIKFAFTGIITFEADPPAFTYTWETQKPYAWTADGQNYTQVAGSQLNVINVFSDGMPVAYFEIVTAENITSLAGTYPVNGEIRDASGAVVQGFDMSIYGMDVQTGSYFVNDANSYIREGTITITDQSGLLNFSGTGLKVQGEGMNPDYSPVVVPVGDINYVDAKREYIYPNLLSAAATDLAAASGGALTGYTVTLKLGEAGVTAAQGPYGVTIGGDGKYISIDFSREAATLPAGTYNIVDNTTAATGDAIAGYYLELFPGFGFPTGCFLVTVAADVEGAPDYITSGTVTVAEAGGVYTVTVNATTGGGDAVQATFTGAITIQ